ncbi:hypothetical protein LTR36_010357 [Oleoguttula mirabilis]|uniref:Uncharacterized protein n=1 Tax=Oleoguttula mirabilis TaxID=1507867 RepID=A0AAV9J5Z1_9PEZI|nr:hypothetical protein LTR36_010357 [Oleoguttula mirabilis]
MAPRKIKRAPAHIVEDSPLLNLPAELRNNIYEYVASNTTSITIRHEDVLYISPMSAVSRQVREEYEGIHRTEASKYAQHVNINIDNFVHEDVMPMIHSLPALASGEERTFRFCILLTNTFEKYLGNVRTLDRGIQTGEDDAIGTARRLECAYSILFDHKSFDVGYARTVVARLRWSYKKKSHQPGALWEWPKIEKAIVQAFERYDARMGPSKGGKRVRKRKAAHETAVEVKAVGKRLKRNKVQ